MCGGADQNLNSTTLSAKEDGGYRWCKKKIDNSIGMGPYGETIKSSVKLVGQLAPKFNRMFLRWYPFRVVSNDLVRQQIRLL